MCLTTERHSTICGHVARHVKFCIEKKNPESALRIFYPRRTKTTNRTSFYEICHTCRRYWKSRGVEEHEAIETTRAYRKENNYYDTVSPYSFEGEKPILMQDIDLLGNEDKNNVELRVGRTNDRSRRDTVMDLLTGWKEDVVEEEIPAGRGEELTKWLVSLEIEDAPSTSREPKNNRTSVSRMTRWPTVPGLNIEDVRDSGNGKGREEHAEQPSLQDNRLARPKQFDPDDVGPSSRPTTRFEIPYIFDREPSENWQQGRVDADGFERQDLHVPTSRQVSKMRSTIQDTENIDATENVQSQLRPPDLDKPLPPPPRIDSPMPGRPFDSQNPERDVAYSNYIPRAL